MALPIKSSHVAFLYVSVLVAGAAVLFLEIIGTRVLGPYYGVTIYLWSTLISITLVSLSIGYAIGGRLADRWPQPRLVYGVLMGSGLWTLLIPLLKAPVIALSGPLGLRGAMFLASSMLFAAPLVALATIGPLALRIRAENLNQVGTTAGNISAVSTVGSMLGAMATGYYLVPNLGVFRLTIAVGTLLIALGVIGFLLFSTDVALIHRSGAGEPAPGQRRS